MSPVPRGLARASLAALAVLAACGDSAGRPTSPDGDLRTPAPRASAAVTTYSLTRASGVGPVGSTDPNTQFHNGSGWTPAFIVAVDSMYAPPIAGTNYITWTPTLVNQPADTTTFRTTFTLPAGFTNPSLVIAVHADNSATFRLNGNFMGTHVSATSAANFQGPPEVFATANPAFFVSGTNVLEIDLHNRASFLGGPTRTALDYLATVQFDCDGILRFGRCIRLVKYVVLDPRDPPFEPGDPPFDPGNPPAEPGNPPREVPQPPVKRVRVALLGSAGFDVSEVDRETVRLAGAPALPGGGRHDVNGDGYPDAVFHFDAASVKLDPRTREACITGTAAGVPFEGCGTSTGAR